jgi:hypothetical protein
MCVDKWKLIRTFALAGLLAAGLTHVAYADIIAQISGPDVPIANIPSVSQLGAGRATQWQSKLAFEDVTVTADLSSFVGMTGTATAFLTTKVGPGTTAANEIAHATVNLPDFFASSHTVTLFTGLNLAPANYYLSIMSAAGIWWMSDSSNAQTTLFPCDTTPCPVTIGAGDPAFPNWQMFTVNPNAYEPASVWTPFTFGLGEYHFSVSGTLVKEVPPTDPPPAAVPEPATLTLTLIGLAGVARARSRSSKSDSARSAR